jgi:hypothetical protein
VAEVSYFRRMVDGVPVVAAPAEIDITTAEQLDAALLAACFGSPEEALKDIGYPVRLMIGIPIVSAPAVINAVTADRLQMVLPQRGPDREARREPGRAFALSSVPTRDIAQSRINLGTAQDMASP